MVPFAQLAQDLAAGTVPNLSYIVPDECHDSHGAPPWCVDSNAINSVQQSFLIAEMDRFAGEIVKAITSSSTWQTGNNAIVITFDEGVLTTSKVATIVITNHGPRGVTDSTSFNHYSLLARFPATDLRPRMPGEQLHRQSDGKSLRHNRLYEHPRVAGPL